MKTAMIFAAGRGERLRPLTDTCPKALCEVHGVPLIEYHIRHLAKAGVNTILINHAYLGGAIRDYLGDGSRFDIQIMYCPEPPGALETGGAIVNARKLIGHEPFITVNADIFTDYDFSALSLSQNRLAHLVLVSQPSYYEHADFGLSKEGLLIQESKTFTFSGIACYNPALFESLKPGRFSITPLIKQQAEAKKVSGEIYQGQWIDIGTTERLKLAHHVDLAHYPLSTFKKIPSN